MTYRVAAIGVIRMSDGKHIMRGMPEWSDYAKWAKKNQPVPAPIVTPSLSSRRQEVARRVDAACQRAINRGPVSLGGHRFNADPATVAAFAAVGAMVANGVPFPANFRWRSADGVQVPMTGGQFRDVLQDMVMHIYRCKEHAAELILVQIPASQDPESIDLAAGWPT